MNHTTLNLQGFNQEELTIVQDVLNDLFFTGGVSFNNALCDMLEAVEVAQPASFILASLFDVEAMSLEIPDHVYESDPLLEWVTCPCCDGEKWLETTGNGWTSALFSDHRRAYAHRHLNSSYKICGRCSGSGEVLDLATPETLSHLEVTSVQPFFMELTKLTLFTPFSEHEAFDELGCSLNKVQTEYENSDFMNSFTTYKGMRLEPIHFMAARCAVSSLP